MPLSQALKPDPRYEQDFHVEDNRFAFSPGQLNKMLNPKSLAAYRALGGLDGLAYGLRTHLTAGLSIDEGRLEGYVTFEDATQPWNPKQHNKNVSMEGAADPSSELPVRENQFADRLRVFGRNKLPDRKPTGFLKLLWNAYNDKIIVLLTIAAVISLSLGLYEAFSGGSKVDWIEGVAICVAILIVTIVTAANDWQKERQFVQLNKRVSYSIFLAEIPEVDFLCRKMTAMSKSSARASRSWCLSLMSWSVTCCILNPAIHHQQMECSFPVMGSSATNLPQQENQTR